MDQKKELALFIPFPLEETPQIHRAFYFPSLCCYFLSQKKQDVAPLCENSFVRVKCPVSLKKVESVMFAAMYERQLPTAKALLQNLAQENHHQQKEMFDLIPNFSSTSLTSLWLIMACQ